MRCPAGKSRLCYEFAERCRAREIPVYEAHGVAHGKPILLLPILELQRGWVGDHGPLFPALFDVLAPGGTLAVQMPRNFSAPSHTLIAEAARSGP